MAELVQEQRLDVFVDSFAFAFQESWDADLPVEFHNAFNADVIVNAFPGRVDLCSAGHPPHRGGDGAGLERRPAR
ncbi:hypothetical protein ACFWPU_35970 [Streptomyces sp. NPDC058471]|uniref:hypothetical protein n=1 Tax=Streptomyces sp. NPDC058471 TaxID=3346516 RepID=UPI003669C352